MIYHLRVQSLKWPEIRARAAKFAKDWKTATYEKGETQTFYNEFFQIFGVKRRSVAFYEHAVQKLSGTTGFVDLFWPGNLLVEQKGAGRSLAKAKEQALEYYSALPPYEHPRYLLLSNFQTFELYDRDTSEEWHFPLSELPSFVKAFSFILGIEKKTFKDQDPVNNEAVRLMASIHDGLAKSNYTGHRLQLLLVRLVFCLFAEDTGIFDQDALLDYIDNCTDKDGGDLGPKLEQLFQLLNTPEEEWSSNIDDYQRSFRYINGDLFSEILPTAYCNKMIRDSLLSASRFNWSKISPAIFGSLFQYVMEEADAVAPPGKKAGKSKKRRELGAHYTTERNILKVVGPLFMDRLRHEYELAKGSPQRLEAFHARLGQLRFLDPACGCGNFLIIAYRELRRLELEVLRDIYGDSEDAMLSVPAYTLSNIDVDAFYGFEIEEFPARVAEVALWLTDHLMNLELSHELGHIYSRIPLKKSPHISHANALLIDWEKRVPSKEVDYVLGNPPFIGHQYRTKVQKADMDRVWGKSGRFGRLDYVTAWYKRATEYIQGNPDIGVAFVSTNSISQGEQAGILWPWMFRYGITINFAHRTFQWTSEAKGKAAVHCVIIGFSLMPDDTKRLFDYETPKNDPEEAVVEHINGYLVNAPDVELPSRSSPPPGMPRMIKGSQPTDGGHLILNEHERSELLLAEPAAKDWIRPYMGGEDLIAGRPRWCLWLKNIPPQELASMSLVSKRVAAVQISRLKSPTQQVREYADMPTLFTQDRQPQKPFIALSEVSSEGRRYIPVTFLEPTTVVANTVQVIESRDLFVFGCMCSFMHNSWVKAVAGRLESRIRYTPSVYNNFPWPEPSASKSAAIEHATQVVLDTRAEFKGANLALLYGPSMPPKLAKAHQALDRAVERAYREKPFESERERVEFLFRLYAERHAQPE